MNKSVLFALLCIPLHNYCQTTNKQNTHSVNTHQKDLLPSEFSTFKALQAGFMGGITGVVMALALPLAKNLDALGPLSYALLASGLVLCLYDMVKRTVGVEYSSMASWTALTTMITAATIMVARE